MRKWLFGLLTTLALCLIFLPGTAEAAISVRVAGTSLEDGFYSFENGTVTTATADDYQIHFEKDTGTLTLNNAQVVMNSTGSGIILNYNSKGEQATLNLIGENVITGQGRSFAVNMTSTWVAQCDEDTQLTIQGQEGASLTTSNMEWGIQAPNLTIDGVSLNMSTTGHSALRIHRDLVVQNTSITTEDPGDGGDFYVSRFIRISGSEIDMSNVNVEYPSIYLDNSHCPEEFKVSPAVVIENSELTIGGNPQSTSRFMLYVNDGGADIKASTLTAAKGRAGIYIGSGTLNICDSSKIDTGDQTAIQAEGKAVIGEDAAVRGGYAVGEPLVNNGSVILTGAVAENMDADADRALGFDGTGTVTVEKTDADGNPALEVYTNSGKQLLTPVETLDLHDRITSITDETTWNTKGYKWEVVTDGQTPPTITSGTLTLKEGFNAAKVTLPGDGANVTVKTEGDSRIDQLEYAGSTGSTAIHLTFEGGKLAVAKLINLSGTPGTSVTVANGAVLEANGGIAVGAAGGVSGTIKVNGTLTARGEGDSAAVLTGKASIGPSGKLEVYGKTGVFLGGENLGTDVDPRMDFTKAFELAPGGRFTGDCGTYIVAAQKNNGGEHDTDLKPEDAIVIPGGYLPAGLAAGFNGDRTELTIPGGGPFNISSDNVPAPPPPSHRHAWAEDWTTSETHHWHVCTASGCPITEDSRKDGYEEHVYDGDRDAECNVCGYVRTVTRPAPPSEPSDDGGSSSPSSSVGGDSRPTAAVTVEPAEHGEVTSDRARAAYSAPVTLTVQPEKGYELESLTVTDRQGIYMKLSELGGGKYAFTMPGGPVTVRAVFRALGEKRCPSLAFSDLDVRLWYHEATDFVLEAGLMNGYADGTFRPNGTLSRAMLAQILYNRAGRPAVTGGGTFADVDSGAWYAPAVAWAVEQGVADGYADGTFRPDAGITREQLAVMLWRCAGRPAAGRALDFADADRAGDYAREALSWAVERGVMSGKSGGVLDPKGAATRAQTAQMLKNQGRNP